MRKKTRHRIERLERRLNEVEAQSLACHAALFGPTVTDPLRRFATATADDGSLVPERLMRGADPSPGLMSRVRQLESL